MRRIFEWIGGFAIVAFSFYFTDKVSLLVAGKSDLMMSIKAVSAEYKMEPVDAVIEGVNIIPGKFGRVVNDQESYLSMHDFGTFNENYLVYDYIKPKISLEDNKDKYIVEGNKIHRYLSLVVEDNEELENKLLSLKIPFDKLADVASDNELIEIISTASTKEKFSLLNGSLKDKAKLCMKDKSNMELCKKHGYYLLDVKNRLTNSNLIDIKASLKPGAITLITPSAKLSDLEIILKEIEYKDMEIVHISKIIDEKENVKE